MTEPDLPYKSVQHFEHRRDAHFLTFSCVDRRAVLVRDDIASIVAARIARGIELHECELLAFVLMPEHVHLLVRSQRSTPVIRALLYSIKQTASFEIRKRLEVSRDPLFAALLRRERSGSHAFRFWQSGPGFDSNIESWQAALEVVEYIHLNPVRRGIVARPEEYRWSSAGQWLSPHERVDPVLPKVSRTRL